MVDSASNDEDEKEEADEVKIDIDDILTPAYKPEDSLSPGVKHFEDL